MPGPFPYPPAYLLSRWVFLRLLGIVYLIAFVSLATQITGLVGDTGILPIGPYLARVAEVYGSAAYRYFPTLLWLGSSDLMLASLAWGGAALSLLLVLGIAPRLMLGLLWVAYLSLTVGGQVFLGFQWDSLLLETGLLAWFVAPRGLWPSLATEAPPSPWGLWLVWWLLFRLMFLSGVTKLASGDPTWRDFTALAYHYETQPLPLWTGWYLHQFPGWFHRVSVAVMFAIELALPCLVLTPPRARRLRQTACAGLVALQLVIAATGNYGFFSLLSILLCLTLLDDGVWGRVFPFALAEHARIVTRPAPDGAWRRRLIAGAAALLLALGGLTFAREITRTAAGAGRPSVGLAWSDPMVDWLQPFRAVNGYGLFRVMTLDRPEIVLEASDDGATWAEWPLGWKPGPLDRRPRLVAPHMPRLDWQLWFAALAPGDAGYWLSSWMTRLLAGDPAVTALMGTPSPTGGTPRFLRLAYYDYRFTTPSERADTGAWWHREFMGYLTDAVPASRGAPAR